MSSLYTQLTLTEVQELLHRQRGRRELGKVLDVFGDVGQRRGLHEGADEVHLAAHVCGASLSLSSG